MARPKEYIGTGEELEPYLKQQPKQLFKLITLEEGEAGMPTEGMDEIEAPNSNEAHPGARTLVEMFTGRVGNVSFDPPDVSTRAEEYFGDIVSEKHEKRRCRT